MASNTQTPSKPPRPWADQKVTTMTTSRATTDRRLQIWDRLARRMPLRRSTPIGISVLCIVMFAASLAFLQMPANAGINIDALRQPYNSNGHPRSYIQLSGTCDGLACITKYKIQYSYYGWRTSGDSETVAALNATTYTGPNATCNKSPGKYRGRMDMKITNWGTTSASFGYRLLGVSFSTQVQTTAWIRESSPHVSGLRC